MTDTPSSQPPLCGEMPTSDLLLVIVKRCKSDQITLFELMKALHERGFGLLMAFFALPTSVPALVPPATTIISIPLIFFSVQMLMGLQSPWLPRVLGQWSLGRKSLIYLLEKAANLLKRIERVLTPRLSFASNRWGERLLGIFSLIFSISVAIPLPFTNLLPSIGILIMSLGLLNRDGVWMIGGMIFGVLGIIFTLLVIILGLEALTGLLSLTGS